MEKGAINMPARQTQSEQQTLTDIRDAIAECDTLRLDPSLPEADRRDMDAAALSVTAMNAPARTLEHFKRLASLATRILREVGRW